MATQQPSSTPARKPVRPQVKPLPGQRVNPDYEVMVTALPNGRQDGWLRLSLVLSPRLKNVPNRATLALFKPLFTHDWPTFVRDLKFDVFIDSPKGAAVRLPTQGEWEFASPPANVPPLDPALWSGIFNESTPVVGHQFDAREFTNENKFRIHTFQEKALFRIIKDELYKPTASIQPERLPPLSHMLERLKNANILETDNQSLSGYRPGVKNAVRELNRIRGLFLKPKAGAGKVPPVIRPQPKPGRSGPLGQGRPPVVPRGIGGSLIGRHLAAPKVAPQQLQSKANMSPRGLNWLRFRSFSQKIGRPQAKPVPRRPAKPFYDFHRILATLFEYPVLARRLGLCVDLRVKLASNTSLPGNGTLWVRPVLKDPGMARRFISPKTRYLLGGATGFMSDPSPLQATQGQEPDSSTLQIQDGMLKFGGKLPNGDPIYDIVPGDVDEIAKRVEVFSYKLLDRVHSLVKPSMRRAVSSELSGALRSRVNPGVIRSRGIHPVLRQKVGILLGRVPAPLPAGRSSGFGVAHNTRDEQLDALLDRSSTHNGTLVNSSAAQRGTDIILTGEDLVRGFRIDVREVRRGKGGAPVFTPWRSLNFRHGTYHLLGPNPPPEGSPLPKPFMEYDDEGWISLGMTEEPDDSDESSSGGVRPGQRLVVYQSLFRWDGWSLCVPRPGRHLGIDDSPQHGQGDRLQTISTMQVLFTPVPGTLPRLRFGRQYQFRARVVDLAGNSLSVTDVPTPNPSFVTDIKDEDSHYLRVEPVPTPMVLLTAPLINPQKTSKLWPNGEPLSPGESADRLVFRTMNLEKPGTPLEGLPASPPSRASARHLVSPKISPDLAEQHGMFDDPKSRRVRGSEAYKVMISKDGSLSDLIPQNRRPPQGKSGAEFYPEPSLLVPYLPDPTAEGVSFVMYAPGTDPTKAPTLQMPFPVQGGWPHVGSLRVQLEPGEGPPKINGPNLLRVFVPLGEERILRISSYLLSQTHASFGNPNQETLFAIWRWIENRSKPQDRERMRRMAQIGRHPMLTPFHELVLVHATQQPVLTPKWVCIEELPEDHYNNDQVNSPACDVQTPAAELARHRRLGDTAATIDGTLAIHRASTEELDIQAEWREPIDRVSETMTSENLAEWLYVNGSAAPFEVKISYVPPANKGPVIGRGVPSEGEEMEAGMEPELDDDFLAPRDAQELPVLPEVQSRGVPGELADDPADLDSGGVQERGVPNIRRGQQAQGPPPYDERPHRCAPAPPPPPPANYGQRFRFQGLHRFGDTKYRCVAYTAIGTTRYREYFRPMPTEEVDLLKNRKVPPRWTRSSQPIMLDILSSAQPEAPKVLYIIPTFKWEPTKGGHRRVGGGLRVYLDRPWFSSGDGEQLAVILYPDPKADLPEKAKTKVTQWGLDPLWESGPRQRALPSKAGKQPILKFNRPGMVQPRGIPEDEVTSRAAPSVRPGSRQQIDPRLLSQHRVGMSHPTPAHFVNALAVRYDLGVKEVPIVTGQARSGLIRFSPMPVTICVFDVKPDISRQLWYCDIEMDPGTAYFPFVRLALARYQVNSIRGAHLSPVVQADFAQLVPDRTASIVVNSQNANQVTVTVAGVGGAASSTRSTRVEVEIEEFNPNIPDELGWTPVTNARPVPLPRVNPQQWTGRVTLPAPSGKQHRLVIKEYEVFQVGNQDEADTGPREEKRLVYADVLPIQR